MKEKQKQPVGRPKGTKQNISFWCDFKHKEIIKKYIKGLK